jgi:hypothetical protein
MFKLSATKKKQKTEFIGARVEPDLKQSFEAACKANGTDINNGLEQLIRQYLEHYAKEIK